MARRFSPLRFSRGLPTRAALQLYADSYTLSGCSNTEHCGVFHRVAAHCTGGYYCAGGMYTGRAWRDATLCDDAPVYQLAKGGSVLYRYTMRGETQWYVGPPFVLGSCYGSTFGGSIGSYMSGSIWGGGDDDPWSIPSLPPDAVGYGWSDPGGYACKTCEESGAIHIVAGDGGGGGR